MRDSSKVCRKYVLSFNSLFPEFFSHMKSKLESTKLMNKHEVTNTY